MQLTIPQQNIWNLQKYYGETAIGNICGAVIMDDDLDCDLLQKAIRWVIASHDALRMHFTEKEGIPSQSVCAPDDHETFPVIRFDKAAQFEAYASRVAKMLMQITNNTLYKIMIAQFDGKTAILVLQHHLISDAWTAALLFRHIMEAYQQLLRGESLPECGFPSYCLFIETEDKYLFSNRYQKDKEYWQNKYAQAPSRSFIRLHDEDMSVSAGQIVKLIPAELCRIMVHFAEENHISVAFLFEAAMILYLARINEDAKNITIGVPVLNRMTASEKQTAGMFVSTLPFTVDIHREASVLQVLQEIQDERYSMYRHQRFPFSEIKRYISEKDRDHGTLYDVIVSYQNARTNIEAHTEWYSNGTSETALQFHIDQRDGEGSYRVTLYYQTEVFRDPSEIDLLFERVCTILEAMVKNPDQKVSDLDIMPACEKQKLLSVFNDTHIAYDRSVTVHELFSRQAHKNPAKIALIFENRQFTFRELDEMSNSLACELRARGAVPNSVIPIVSGRSWQIVVAMLGIMKAGSAYLPIDPAYPESRITGMMDIANCSIALTYGYAKDALHVETIKLEDFNYSSNPEGVCNRNTSEDLCYVIFTSGTTGEPKAISIRHRNLINFINADPKSQNRYQSDVITQCDYVIASNNTAFDITMQDIFLPLCNGKTVIFLSDSAALHIEKGLPFPQRSHLVTTPTKIKLYMQSQKFIDALNMFSVIMVGSEELSPGLVEKIRQHTGAVIYNGYGPTETTCGSLYDRIDEQSTITIGKPIANTQVYILDSRMQPVPIGVVGELCIAGDGVGGGYLNRPDLTAERFIPNPFETAINGHGKTMYRTGDLARWNTDGRVEYLGRIDTQIKIHGLRVELGEIENVVASFPGIKMTAVTNKKNESGRQYLVGYYTSENHIDETSLREYLSSRLPRYMVPNYLVQVDEIPLTASGKTDRRSLPDPLFTHEINEYAAPENQQEEILCGIITDLLDVETVGIDDDFFSIGGDSLNAIAYSARAEEKGIIFSIQDVYTHPTVRALSNWLACRTKEKKRFIPENCEAYDPLLKRNHISNAFCPVYRALGNVFLTGVTGFLGAHILNSLIKDEKGKIYCLVRGRNYAEAEKYFKERMTWYFGDQFEGFMDNRVILIPGDVTQAHLFDHLPEDVDTVIHAAANVKHYGNYDEFETINVNGTQNIITYSRKIHARLIHISTISVSGNSLAEDNDVYHSQESKTFSESDLYIGQQLDNVYLRSKFEAERCVLDAIGEGLDAFIVRIGNLTNRSTDMVFQPNFKDNAFLKRIKVILELGMIPDYLLSAEVEFTPVDLAAEGIIRMAQYASEQTVFHLCNDRPLSFERMTAFIRDLGLKMEIVDGHLFAETIKKTMNSQQTEYIYETLQHDLDSQGILMYQTNIHPDTAFSHWFLEKTGFAWTETDFRYFSEYVRYFRKLGYFNI